MKNLVILGAGTAGTIIASRLARVLPGRGWQITVVDRDDQHIYQPGLLFVPFGQSTPEELVRPRTRLLPPEVKLDLRGFRGVDTTQKQVRLGDDTLLPYDILVVATGVELDPGGTPGLTGPGWYESAFDFYTLEGAARLAKALDRMDEGRVVLNVAEMPIKCPVAPLEFLFLADAFFTTRGCRSKVEIVYATPLEGAFTKPRASAALSGLLSQRNIHVEGEFAVSAVDGEARKLQSWDGRALDYDLLVTVPLHRGTAALADSGLTDAQGFVTTDRHTLRHRTLPDVFAIGDCTDLPSSKAGAVAHFQSEVLAPNIVRHIEDRPLDPGFDGHANCFIETGFDKAMLIDFNYTTEPLPGRFPLPGIGPFTLLEESRVNHWGKLGFRWVYWNLLLRGEDLPIDHRMVMAGKWS
jgi:sulfide:quinone oxidoreductase